MITKEEIKKIVDKHAKLLNKEHFSQKDPWLIRLDCLTGDIEQEIFKKLKLPMEEVNVETLKKYNLVFGKNALLIYPKKINKAKQKAMLAAFNERERRERAAAILGAAPFDPRLKNKTLVNKVLKEADKLAKKYK
jgi:hypothetical protein